MQKKIGFHTGEGWASYIETIKRWQPPVILILTPNKDKVKLLREACPNAILVGRIYVEDSTMNDAIQKDPVNAAWTTHVTIMDYNDPNIDYWVMSNEPTPYWDKIPAINTYNLELMKLADANGYKVGILAFSVGNPDLPEDNPMAYWQLLKPCLNYCQEHDHVVLMHQYQKPNLINKDESDDWLIFRLERKVLPGLKTMGLDRLKFIISELGVDHLINSGQIGGFQKTPLTDREYVNQLLEWERIEQAYPQILGGCIFMLGSQTPWQSYSITNKSDVAHMLADHYANTNYDGEKPMTDNAIYIPAITNEEPTVPTGVDWDERLTARGVVLKPYSPKDGEAYWKCIKGEYLEEKEHIFVNTLDEKGKQKPGVTVVYYWADGSTTKSTKDITNDPYAYGMADMDMHAHGNSYGTHIDAPSDDVWGMGLGSVEQPDWNIHVSYRFTFQLTKKKKTATKPATKPVDTSPAPSIPAQTGFAPFTGKVIATVLNVRSEPKMANNIVNKLANGAVVQVVSRTSDGWYKIGDDQWVAEEWVEHYQEESQVIDTLVDNFARIYHIEPNLVRAAFTIESGGKPFGVNGKPIIRFENHIFFRELNNPTLYYKYFNHVEGNTGSHRWRPDENSEWVDFHGNQKLEWQVFEFAKKLNQNAAERSTSFGMGQIMGFNFDDIDYLTPTHMIEAFSAPNLSGVISQVCAFFAYCVNKPGALDALRNKDFRQFALLYNGAESYAKLIEDQYKLLQQPK